MGPKKSAGKKGAAPENGGEMVSDNGYHVYILLDWQNITLDIWYLDFDIISYYILTGCGCQGENVHAHMPVTASSAGYGLSHIIHTNVS